MFKVGDRVIHLQGIFGFVPLGGRGEVIDARPFGQVKVLFGKGPTTSIELVEYTEIELDPTFGWVRYGKTYGELHREMVYGGQSLVGLQADLQADPPHHPAGVVLIGHISHDGRSSGHRFYDPQIVIRYRRLVTPEQLESK